MRKWLVFFMIIVTLFSFFSIMHRYERDWVQYVKNGERRDQALLVILDQSVDQQNPSAFYNGLIYLLDINSASVFYTFVDEQNKTITKYIREQEAWYQQGFPLVAGNYMDSLQGPKESYVSTNPTLTQERIGQLANFRKAYTVTVKPLEAMIADNKPFGTRMVVQVAASQLNTFKNMLEVYTGAEVYVEKASTIKDEPFTQDRYLWVVYLLMALLMFYSVLSQVKRIGVYQLMGMHPVEVFWHLVKVSYLMVFSCIFIGYTGLTIVMIAEWNGLTKGFVQDLVKQGFILAFLCVVLISAPAMVLFKIHIVHMIKQKKPTRFINAFNYGVKVVLLMVLFVALMSNSLSLSQVTLRKEQFSVWESTENLYVIPSLTGFDSDFMSDPNFRIKQMALYLHWNKTGSILADFSDFEPIRINRNTHVPLYLKDSMVNPNYLKENPIMDLDGESIVIEEDYPHYVLLVPELYRPYEAEIIERYDFVKASSTAAMPDGNLPYIDQELVLIWVANQSLFTYNPSIEPKHDNYIENPVIRVLTEKNGDYWDYDRLLAYAGVPFKIKTFSDEPVEEIREVLATVDMDKHVPYIYAIYDYVASEVSNRKDFQRILMTLIMVLALVLIILVFQNSYNYMDKNRKTIVIKKLLGIGKLGRYGGYIGFMLLSWILPMIILLRDYTHALVSGVVIIGAGILIECMLSGVCFAYLEKRHQVAIIKEA